jgi:Uma2 family endonuclease
MMEPMPRVPPFDRAATYDDLAQLTDHVVAEIVGGELHATPRPAPRHSVVWSSLTGLLNPPFQHGRGGPGGWWILGEPELHLDADVLVPDLAGWRRSRLPTMPEQAYFSLPPDWVCEVVSPATALLDRAKKLVRYAYAGVGSAWLVDPIGRTVEVYRLTNGHWLVIGVHGGAERLRAEPFEEVELDLSVLWPDEG